jgi:2-dehydro-3-deoxyphosphooctonate aldolase (KDO 8-P synthase)
MAGAVEKLQRAGAYATAVTERGTIFGYGDLVVDMRSFRRLKEATGAAVLYDATHAVQRPGMGPGGVTGGCRADIPQLMYAAAAAGADGFFVETHPNPDEALSDRESMVLLKNLRGLVEKTLDVWMRANAETVIGT